MKSPKIPSNEKERIDALKSYSILDTLQEKEYDDITYLASMICGTSMSLISLIDENRQWFKSDHGLDATETPREFAFCAHALNEKDKTLIVKDAREDDRFKHNPLVTSSPNLVFYAGVPLVNSDGYALGTLCVLDGEPKTLTVKQEKALEILSNQLMKLLELRKSTILLHENSKILKSKNIALDKFVSIAAHDIKTPINNILSMSEMLSTDHIKTMDSDGAELVDYIKTSAKHCTDLINGILSYSKEVGGISAMKESINIKDLLLEIKKLFIKENVMQMTIDTEDDIVLFANRTALQQIFSNLISNSIKYNHQDLIKIHVKVAESDSVLNISIKDNGPGIKSKDKKEIFKLFATTMNKDRDGFHGTGIGLATVKSLVENLGGKISVASKEGTGAKFKFTLKK